MHNLKVCPMELLKQRILRDGKVLSDHVLKVDNFINHQLDAQLMMSIGVEFARRFSYTHANKILTIEASGIAPAVMTGYCMGIPVVFAKKTRPCTMDKALESRVHSFTKDKDYTILLNPEYIKPGDKVLCIDDFLANGSVANAMQDLVEQAGATIVGLGIVIEKAFIDGGKKLREKGLNIESLARIESLEGGIIKFVD